jgi:hypothetical protein
VAATRATSSEFGIMNTNIGFLHNDLFTFNSSPFLYGCFKYRLGGFTSRKSIQPRKSFTTHLTLSGSNSNSRLAQFHSFLLLSLRPDDISPSSSRRRSWRSCPHACAAQTRILISRCCTSRLELLDGNQENHYQAEPVTEGGWHAEIA